MKNNRLREIRVLSAKCDILSCEIDLLYQQQLQAVKFDNVGGNGDDDNTLHLVEKILNRKEEYTRMLRQFENEKKDIIDLILKLDDPNKIRILYLRYCKNYNYRKIAKEMNYSIQHIKKLHSDALREIEQIETK